MDTNAALEEIRSTYAEMQRIEDAPDDPPTDADRYARHAELSARLRELIEGLDTWITRGGFLPQAWQQASQAPQPARLKDHRPRPDGPLISRVKNGIKQYHTACSRCGLVRYITSLEEGAIHCHNGRFFATRKA